MLLLRLVEDLHTEIDLLSLWHGCRAAVDIADFTWHYCNNWAKLHLIICIYLSKKTWKVEETFQDSKERGRILKQHIYQETWRASALHLT